MNVSVLILIILLFKEGTQATTSMTEYTILTGTKHTANDAADICRSREAELLKMDTLEIFHALTVFYQNTTVANQQKAFWTGLHFPSSLGTSGYRWDDCSPLSSPTFFNNTASKGNCVSVRPRDLFQLSDVWVSDKCKSKNYIICQKPGGECTEFKQFPSYIHLSSDAGKPVETSSIPGILTKEMCQLQCLSSQHQECLGFTLLARQCTLYLAESVADIWTQANSTAGLYIKFCYSAVFESVDDKRKTYQNELEPIRLCMDTTTDQSVLSVSTAKTGRSLKTTNNYQTTQAHTLEYDSDEQTDLSSTRGKTEVNIIISTIVTPSTDKKGSITSTENVKTAHSTPFTKTATISEELHSKAWTSLDTSTILEHDGQVSDGYSGTPVQMPWVNKTLELVSTQPGTVMATGSIVYMNPLPSTHEIIEAQTSSTAYKSTIAPETIQLTTPTTLKITAQDDKADVASLETTGSEINCLCPCSNNRPEKIFTVVEKNEMINYIVQHLYLNKDTLSSTVRKKTSAQDHRPSSKGIGVLAIVFLVMFFGGIVAADFPVLVREIKMRVANAKPSDSED